MHSLIHVNILYNVKIFKFWVKFKEHMSERYLGWWCKKFLRSSDLKTQEIYNYM